MAPGDGRGSSERGASDCWEREGAPRRGDRRRASERARAALEARDREHPSSADLCVYVQTRGFAGWRAWPRSE